MRKSESILQMEMLEMNTLDYFITSDEKEVIHYLAKFSETPISLRTERGDEFLCPFLYMIPGRELHARAMEYLSKGYTLIMAPSLNTKGCRMFGAVSLREGENDFIDYVRGEGTCRELEHHPGLVTVPITSRLVPVSVGADPNSEVLNTVYREVYDLCYDLVPCVVEWSWYDHPVGRKGKNLIFWEIRNE